MPHAFRIRFKDEDAAYRLFHVFPGNDLPLLGRLARKRDGRDHVVLLDTTDDDVEKFLELCRSNPAVVAVLSISEAEFWTAPSNAI
jgi:hypothetical protein